MAGEWKICFCIVVGLFEGVLFKTSRNLISIPLYLQTKQQTTTKLINLKLTDITAYQYQYQYPGKHQFTLVLVQTDMAQLKSCNCVLCQMSYYGMN